jgi:uncharacterized protein YndB with AHSA1/START domain
MSPLDKGNTMTCAYDAPGHPPGHLIEGHTAPEPQEHWRGPNGLTLPSWEVDFGDGGGSRVRSPEGRGYSVEGVRREIVEPERIVFTGDLGFAGGTVTFRRA